MSATPGRRVPRRSTRRSPPPVRRAGAAQLADVEGVVGTLLDVVEVDDGYEPAFEAGAGEAIASVVVDGVPVAR